MIRIFVSGPARAEALIKEIEAEAKLSINFSIFKFDASSEEEIEKLAKDSYRNMIARWTASFRCKLTKVKSAIQEADDIPNGWRYGYRRRLEEAESLFALFGFSQDEKNLLDAFKELVASELSATTLLIKDSREKQKAAKESPGQPVFSSETKPNEGVI